MPLEQSSSKEAFQHNVSAEINAGKPKEQAVAIAYGVQRANDSTPEYSSAYAVGLPDSIAPCDILDKSRTYGG